MLENEREWNLWGIFFLHFPFLFYLYFVKSEWSVIVLFFVMLKCGDLLDLSMSFCLDLGKGKGNAENGLRKGSERTRKIGGKASVVKLVSQISVHVL